MGMKFDSLEFLLRAASPCFRLR